MRPAALALAALTALAGALAGAVLSHSGAAATRQPVPWATLAVSRSVAAGGGIYLIGNGERRLVAREAYEPDWSPDGRRLAYVAPGPDGSDDVWVADANGANAGRLTDTPGIFESAPSWSPDGRRLVLEQDGKVVVIRADGTARRVLARGGSPAWSPGGARIAFVRSGDLYAIGSDQGAARALVATPAAESEPAWSPDGRLLAYVSDETDLPDVRLLTLATGATVPLTADALTESAPAFSTDGARVLFVTNGTAETLWSVPVGGGVATPVGGPSAPAHASSRPRPELAELSPDLDQQAPSDLGVRPARRGFRLWFTSAADNVGLGPLVVNGRRRSTRGPMPASQRVQLANGRFRTQPEIGTWQYNASPDHAHWHLLHFQRYELRRLDGTVVLRDRKSGFCIGDRYGVAPGRIAGRIPRPVFRGFCNTYQPAALRVDGGTSVGYSDRYHSRLDGQNLDITRVPAGDYLLVNRVNTELRIRELRYENNAASVRIRIAWPLGWKRPPTVRVLRRCPGSARC